jgi:peptide/nickel transport system substrate-binding protein
MPQRGGAFIGAISGDPQTANLDLTTDTNASDAFTPLFSSLIALTKDQQVVADLADSWTISPDGLRYEFKLNKNAMFHDGQAVTSADVQYSLEVAAKYQAKAGPILKNLDRIETPDANTIVLTLKKPSAVFLKSLNTASVVILSKRQFNGASDPRTATNIIAPIGSGPFKFKEWVKGDHITLTRNDSYFKPGLPYLDQWISRIIPDAGSRSIAFQKGDIDYIRGQFVAREQLPDLQKVAGMQVDQHGGYPGEELLEFNLTRKPFNDVRVREAIVEKGYVNAGAQPSKSHIPADLTAFFDPSIKLPQYDVTAANKLLDEAGYPKGADGTRFRVKLSFLGGVAADAKSAAVLKDNLKDVGIQVDLDPIEAAISAKQIFTDANFDMFVAALTSLGDPDLGIARFYLTSSIGVNNGNGSRYSNPAVDQAFADGGMSIDPAARKTAYAKVQAILAKDLPTFPLVDYSNIDVAGPAIGGLLQAPYHYARPELLWRKP